MTIMYDVSHSHVVAIPRLDWKKIKYVIGYNIECTYYGIEVHVVSIFH